MALSEETALKSSWTTAEAFQSTRKGIWLNQQEVSQLNNIQGQIQEANLDTWSRQVETVALPWQCKGQNDCPPTLWTLLLHYEGCAASASRNWVIQ